MFKRSKNIKFFCRGSLVSCVYISFNLLEPSPKTLTIYFRSKTFFVSFYLIFFPCGQRNKTGVIFIYLHIRIKFSDIINLCQSQFLVGATVQGKVFRYDKEVANFLRRSPFLLGITFRPAVGLDLADVRFDNYAFGRRTILFKAYRAAANKLTRPEAKNPHCTPRCIRIRTNMTQKGPVNSRRAAK